MTPPADHYILFVVSGTTYALPTTAVAYIEMIDEVTRVPNAAPFIEGLVFSRGQVVPAVNLRLRFGFERAPADLRTRLLVVQAHGRAVGFIVDACREFLTIPAEVSAPPGDALGRNEAHYLTGIAAIGGRLVALVDLDKLLAAVDPALTASA